MVTLRTALQGSFPVVARSRKNFTIQCNEKKGTVSIDRLKAAFLGCPNGSVSPAADNPPPSSKVQQSSADVLPLCMPNTPVDVEPPTHTTRSSR